ncbi:PH and SEC7 domain-containing protein 3 isoform X1 [Elephas maximus indicus]|uniref:PH and SEC7 domain-containing protein 3 isoform X1 n=2 Tax=Elephas maximus indicus TaxID=99487 RepID=UPI002115DD63|nr:PH and SEC7 domain-containing protein 3 isoform X1 [Elephas maximus indicus]XP_049722024.1 PH and SEC7 domain-containing protein 3 isoform X1 [Elephas maximus indicus]XP_049722025.1 PH and SEC7 domain-containing protein 3 isoform X1 [Elephas maximus indicus]XP_049722026.1 PH and SEC7 domain-containing protein 3 isoform X1 [Elephas maximus indicus]XP_049722027.1 PH and SEC7 domain-containing protein 3 isoform X1 [Elephas maximus indicus]XP_049722028.1 PH and SEC7 domain-containing protein 3 
MAEQPQQLQMKTSFLFIQLQAPPAAALPALHPAAAAWKAALGGPEEGHIFRSPRTGFLAGQDLRRTQGLAAPPSRPLHGEGHETETPAAFSCSVLKEKKEGVEKPQDLDLRRGGVCGSPHHRRCLAPASGKLGQLPLPCRRPRPALIMSRGSSSPFVSCEHWPVTSAPQGLWSMDHSSRDALVCSIPQATLANAAHRNERAVLRRGGASFRVLPKSCEEGTGSAVWARRAQLCRYCPPVQTSKIYPAPPAALRLKAETFVWVNDASAHSQSVAKAKYKFLFGSAGEKTPDTSDHGGSSLLPPNVTNEFPEYGTMEESGEGLRASLEFDAELLPRCPQGQQGAQLLAGHHSELDSVTEGPKDAREAPFQSHLKEQSLQPLDSLISALKATETRIALGTLQATKVLDKDAISSFSVQQVEKELDTASQKTQGANKRIPASQGKPPAIPLSAEVTTEENFYLSIQKDLTALLTGETQSELSQITSNGRKGTLCVQESLSTVESPSVTHNSAGSVGYLRERRSDLGLEHPGECDQGSSTGRPGRIKHVEFQGVEILWTGGEKRETRYPVDLATSVERTASPESKEFSKGPSHLISSAGLCNSVGLSESGWDETWKASERPGTSSGGTFSPAPLVESGEDEVFLKENKQHPETKPELERDKERIPEQEEHIREGDDDILGPGYTEDSTDVYSSQFETILDNTSLYYSAESLETLYSEPDSYFSFEMPLTPMIQQRIKEGGQFLERTSGGGQQDVLSVSADGRIVMGYSSGITNGLNDSTDSIYMKGTPEIAFWGSNAGVKKTLLDARSEMGSTEILEKETPESLSNGTSSNVEAAKRLAKRLYQLDRFKRSDVAKHLGKNNEFSKLVAEEYLKFFDFTGMTLDQSLRYFFKAFSLVGETQERERVLVHFSNRYFYCNPDTITSQDGVHCLTCAMMLLNTDLHGHNIGKKMTCQEFIANLQGVNEGGDFSKDLLKALYNSIKNEKLEWAADDEEKKKSPSEGTDEKANGTHPKTLSRIGSTTNPFLDIPHDPNATVYKSGFLARKIHADMDGKKTPRGKRGWKTFYAVLKGTVLYLQKDEYKPEKALSEEDLKNAVSVHHALASKATDYEKKPNVLKLKTADWRVLLFQAQSPEEMQGWINKINCVAAVFSAPPFPAAIGSQKKFSRPLLPATTTKLSQEEQLKSHESKLKQITTELAEHRSYPPDKKVKAKEIDEYKLKDHYLEFEKTRYDIYVSILKEGGQELLSNSESEGAGLKKSHSSPSLNPDSSPVTAKIKRNVSERKDHRPETPSIKQKVT